MLPRALILLLLAALPAAAQTVPRVTATFKTPENKTPAAAGLKVVATIASVAVYGTVDFVPYDAAGNRVTRILCGATTYVPSNVHGWIKGDGTLMDAAGVAGVKLIPTEDCTPAGLVMRATISLPASTNGRRTEVVWIERKQVPQETTVDWGSLDPE